MMAIDLILLFMSTCYRFNLLFFSQGLIKFFVNRNWNISGNDEIVQHVMSSETIKRWFYIKNFPLKSKAAVYLALTYIRFRFITLGRQFFHSLLLCRSYKCLSSSQAWVRECSSLDQLSIKVKWTSVQFTAKSWHRYFGKNGTWLTLK